MRKYFHCNFKRQIEKRNIEVFRLSFFKTWNFKLFFHSLPFTHASKPLNITYVKEFRILSYWLWGSWGYYSKKKKKSMGKMQHWIKFTAIRAKNLLLFSSQMPKKIKTIFYNNIQLNRNDLLSDIAQLILSNTLRW